MEYLSLFKNTILEWFQRDKKLILFSVCGGLIITISTGMFLTKAYSENIQKGIADSVVRFHVLANSDEAYDQELKLEVRDAVLLGMTDSLKQSNSIEQTKEILEKEKDEIRQIALNMVESKGYDYDVKVTLSRDLFPQKQYGDIVFPAGIYDAVRIEIGEAKGKNWWCVMFPPLCFVDVSYSEISEQGKEKLQNVLSEEEYDVVASQTKDSVVPEIKFKIVEWWQERQITKLQSATEANKGEGSWHRIKG